MSTRRDRAKVAAKIKAYLRWIESEESEAQIADMLEATAGSTHPDAVAARDMLTYAREAGTPKKRKYFLRRAWDHTKDFVYFDNAVEGEKVMVGRKAGGAKTAKNRKLAAMARAKKLQDEAAKLKDEKKEVIAATLADRGFGGRVAIGKILRRTAKKS